MRSPTRSAAHRRPSGRTLPRSACHAERLRPGRNTLCRRATECASSVARQSFSAIPLTPRLVWVVSAPPRAASKGYESTQPPNLGSAIAPGARQPSNPEPPTCCEEEDVAGTAPQRAERPAPLSRARTAAASATSRVRTSTASFAVASAGVAIAGKRTLRSQSSYRSPSPTVAWVVRHASAGSVAGVARWRGILAASRRLIAWRTPGAFESSSVHTRRGVGSASHGKPD